jgi:hypothetical protein
VGVGLDGKYQIEERAFEKGYQKADVYGLAPGGVKGVDRSERGKKEDGGTEFGTALNVDWIVEQIERFTVSFQGDERDDNG